MYLGRSEFHEIWLCLKTAITSKEYQNSASSIVNIYKNLKVKLKTVSRLKLITKSSNIKRKLLTKKPFQ